VNDASKGFLVKCNLTPEDVAKVAQVYNISVPLILAIIQKESSGRPKAMRYEPKYRWVHNSTVSALTMKWTQRTEEELQRFSYGLMQIMGGTARDLGFPGHFFDLLDPVMNLNWGTHYLWTLWRRYSGSETQITDVISAYNQGSARRKLLSKEYCNQSYVNQVLDLLKNFRDV